MMMARIIKQASLMVSMGLLIAGCNPNKSQETTANGEGVKQRPTSTLNHKPIDVDTLNLSLNNGKKWKVDSTTLLQMVKIENQVEEYGRKIRSLDAGAYKKLAADINHALRQIKAEKKLNNNAAKNLAPLLNHIERETAVLEEGDRKKAQVALFNLSELVKAFDKYFTME